MRARLGLAGLLAFEGLLVAYTLAYGAVDHAAMAAAAMAGLGWALVAHARSGRVPRAALVLLAAVTLARALRQTAFGSVDAGVLPTFLVPLGFALLLWPRAPPTWGLGLVAAARTWFVAWYALAGVPTLVLANVLGAVGAWLWWSAEAMPARPAPADDVALQP